MPKIRRYLVGIQDSWLLTDRMTTEERGYREIGVYAHDLQSAAAKVVHDYPGVYFTFMCRVSQSGNGTYYTGKAGE